MSYSCQLHGWHSHFEMCPCCVKYSVSSGTTTEVESQKEPMTTTKNEIPPELVKIRDERCPSDLNFRKECDENSFRCGAKISWKEGFNDAFHLGRQFERDELAKQSTEFDQLRIERAMTISKIEDDKQRETIIDVAKWQHQQTSLAFEAKIAKLEEKLRQYEK